MTPPKQPPKFKGGNALAAFDFCKPLRVIRSVKSYAAFHATSEDAQLSVLAAAGGAAGGIAPSSITNSSTTTVPASPSAALSPKEIRHLSTAYKQHIAAVASRFAPPTPVQPAKKDKAFSSISTTAAAHANAAVSQVLSAAPAVKSSPGGPPPVVANLLPLLPSARSRTASSVTTTTTASTSTLSGRPLIRVPEWVLIHPTPTPPFEQSANSANAASTPMAAARAAGIGNVEGSLSGSPSPSVATNKERRQSSRATALAGSLATATRAFKSASPARASARLAAAASAASAEAASPAASVGEKHSSAGPNLGLATSSAEAQSGSVSDLASGAAASRVSVSSLRPPVLGAPARVAYERPTHYIRHPSTARESGFGIQIFKGRELILYQPVTEDYLFLQTLILSTAKMMERTISPEHLSNLLNVIVQSAINVRASPAPSDSSRRPSVKLKGSSFAHHHHQSLAVKTAASAVEEGIGGDDASCAPPAPALISASILPEFRPCQNPSATNVTSALTSQITRGSAPLPCRPDALSNFTTTELVAYRKLMGSYITDEVFAFAIHSFEILTGVKPEVALFDVCFAELKTRLGTLCPSAHIVSKVYEHWKLRRQLLGKPLLREFWPVTSAAATDANPFAVFRARTKEKMILRRPRRNLQDTQARFERVGEELKRVEKLFKKSRTRDLTKLALVELDCCLYQQILREQSDPQYELPGWPAIKRLKFDSQARSLGLVSDPDDISSGASSSDHFDCKLEADVIKVEADPDICCNESRNKPSLCESSGSSSFDGVKDECSSISHGLPGADVGKQAYHKLKSELSSPALRNANARPPGAGHDMSSIEPPSKRFKSASGVPVCAPSSRDVKAPSRDEPRVADEDLEVAPEEFVGFFRGVRSAATLLKAPQGLTAAIAEASTVCLNASDLSQQRNEVESGNPDRAEKPRGVTEPPKRQRSAASNHSSSVPDPDGASKSSRCNNCNIECQSSIVRAGSEEQQQASSNAHSGDPSSTLPHSIHLTNLPSISDSNQLPPQSPTPHSFSNRLMHDACQPKSVSMLPQEKYPHLLKTQQVQAWKAAFANTLADPIRGAFDFENSSFADICLPPNFFAAASQPPSDTSRTRLLRRGSRDAASYAALISRSSSGMAVANLVPAMQCRAVIRSGRGRGRFWVDRHRFTVPPIASLMSESEDEEDQLRSSHVSALEGLGNDLSHSKFGGTTSRPQEQRNVPSCLASPPFSNSHQQSQDLSSGVRSLHDLSQGGPPISPLRSVQLPPTRSPSILLPNDPRSSVRSSKEGGVPSSATCHSTDGVGADGFASGSRRSGTPFGGTHYSQQHLSQLTNPIVSTRGSLSSGKTELSLHNFGNCDFRGAAVYDTGGNLVSGSGGVTAGDSTRGGVGDASFVSGYNDSKGLLYARSLSLDHASPAGPSSTEFNVGAYVKHILTQDVRDSTKAADLVAAAASLSSMQSAAGLNSTDHSSMSTSGPSASVPSIASAAKGHFAFGITHSNNYNQPNNCSPNAIAPGKLSGSSGLAAVQSALLNSRATKSVVDAANGSAVNPCSQEQQPVILGDSLLPSPPLTEAKEGASADASLSANIANPRIPGLPGSLMSLQGYTDSGFYPSGIGGSEVSLTGSAIADYEPGFTLPLGFDVPSNCGGFGLFCLPRATGRRKRRLPDLLNISADQTSVARYS